MVLTDRVTQLDGTRDSRSRPAPDVDVLVFPDEPALWAFPARHVRALKTAADGTFRVRGMPPHQSYFAVALDYLDDGETQDPEFLEGLRDQRDAVLDRLRRVAHARSARSWNAADRGTPPRSIATFWIHISPM